MAGHAADIAVDREAWIEEQRPAQQYALLSHGVVGGRHVFGQGLEQGLRLPQELLVVGLGDGR
jgi:hypothetical protein